jgi:hypothetical protein
MSIFKTLSEINVNNHVEQKGKFNYLSWAWAVAELRLASPTATWEVVKTDGLPFCKTECGYFVEVAVTVDGITLSQIHPVLDNQNKTIPVPNAFQINTSIQRCLVKAIALHGLGLYIYAGEDLPDTDEVPTIGRAAQALKVDVPALVKQITDTQSLTDLLKVFSEVYPKTKNDPVATKLIIAAKDEMKSLFEESGNE